MSQPIWQPYYVLAQREAVETGEGVPVAIDPGFLLTGQMTDEEGKLTNETALMLFTSLDRAERCLTKVPKGFVVATFRDANHLRECVQAYITQQYRWVLIDRYSNGQNRRIDDFLSSVG